MRWPTVLFRLIVEGPRVLLYFLLGLFTGFLAEHFHVTAEGKDSQLVLRFAALEAAAWNGRPKADAERLHVHVAPLGGQEMTELMDEDDEAQSENDQEDVPQDAAGDIEASAVQQPEVNRRHQAGREQHAEGVSF